MVKGRSVVVLVMVESVGVIKRGGGRAMTCSPESHNNNNNNNGVREKKIKQQHTHTPNTHTLLTNKMVSFLNVIPPYTVIYSTQKGQPSVNC